MNDLRRGLLLSKQVWRSPDSTSFYCRCVTFLWSLHKPRYATGPEVDYPPFGMDLPAFTMTDSLPSRTFDHITDPHLSLIVGLALIAGLVASGGDISVHGIVILEPLFGLVIAVALSIGLVGLIGVAVGSFLGMLLTSGDAFLAAAHILSFLLGGLIATTLWIPSHQLASWNHVPRRAVSTTHFVGVVGCAVSVTAVMLSLVYELIGIRPLYAGILASLISLGIAGLVLGGTLLLGIHFISSYSVQPAPISRKRRYVLAGLGPLWLSLATIGSAGFHLGAAVPPWLFDRQGLGWATLLVDEAIFGVGAIRIQLLLGSFMLAIMIVMLSTTLLTRVKTA